MITHNVALSDSVASRTDSMIRGRDIVFISSIEWDFLWQHAQEIASRLARAGNRVLYIENTGIRTPGLKDTGRVARRLRSWIKARQTKGIREVESNLYVCSPLVLPPFGSRVRTEINRKLFLPLIYRYADGLGFRDPLIWTHLPTNTALDLIEHFRGPNGLVVYYCIADFSQLTPHAAELKESEQAIIEISDLVFANSTSLAEHCKDRKSSVHVFPPGLNINSFPEEEGAVDGSAEVDEISQHFHRTNAEAVIGYVGGLHRHIDLGLLVNMARARPEWLWVLIGPSQTALGELPRLSNVLLLGHRPHYELFRYIQQFDVCIVPYRNNNVTASVVPVKINEYLAAGKPVVATALPSVCEFNAQHKILFTAKAEATNFLRAIEEALTSPNGDEVVERRRQIAVSHNWDVRIERMCELIEVVWESKNRPNNLNARLVLRTIGS